MAPRYRYIPLPLETDEIRLLTLLPASNKSEDIVITLRNSPTAAAARPYEALSYVWGSAVSPEAISVVTSSTTGAKGGAVSPSTRTLLVTQNLAIALRHLRFRDTARTLWVDAICINQQNVAERSEQVGKMGQVYRSAARVVIWLGPASPDSDLAMELVDHLGQVLRFDQLSNTFTSTPKGAAESHWADITQQLPYKEGELCALDSLFGRPWFERLWVVQEVLISQNAIIICGRQETTWQAIMVAMFCLRRKDTKTYPSGALGDRLLQVERVFGTISSPSLMELVLRT